MFIIYLRTTNHFSRLYKEGLNTAAARENNYTFTFVASIAYDAVWSLALALKNTNAMLRWPKECIIQETNCQDDGTDLDGFQLDDFTYNHSFIGCIIQWNLAKTDFIGVSVSVVYPLMDCRCMYIIPHLMSHSGPSEF